MNATDTIAELQERVRALEEAQADTLTPGVFFINKEGKIEEILTGKLTAKGVVFQEGSAELIKALESQVRWVDEESIIREFVQGFVSAFPAQGHTLLMSAGESAAEALATLTLTGKASAGGTAKPKVAARAGTSAVTLVDDSGRSSFLQLATLAKRRLALGTVVVEWQVKGITSNQPTVKTGLTAIDAFVFMPFAGSAGFVGGLVTEPQPGEMRVEVRSLLGEQAAGTQVGCYWIAIGE